jgi:hypothetical protein
MRFSVLVATLSLGCGEAPASMEPTPPEPGFSTDWRLTAQPLLSTTLREAGQTLQGTFVLSSERTYGLGSGFPTEVRLLASDWVYGLRCRTSPLTTMRWNAVRIHAGTAASLNLVEEGELRVSLLHDGDLVADIDGLVDGIDCPDGARSQPLRHRLSLHVRTVTAFRLAFSSIPCGPRPIAPAGVPLWLPNVQAVDAKGEPFYPANRYPAAALTVRGAILASTGVLPTVILAPGPVELSLDSPLPMLGIQGYDIVDHTAVTGITASLKISLEASKGSTSQPLVEGATVHLLRAGENNHVFLEVEEVRTSKGTLCGNAPTSWFLVDSSTQSVCSTPAAVRPFGHIPLVSLNRPGRCQFEASLAGGSLRWAGAFTIGSL